MFHPDLQNLDLLPMHQNPGIHILKLINANEGLQVAQGISGLKGITNNKFETSCKNETESLKFKYIFSKCKTTLALEKNQDLETILGKNGHGRPCDI